MYHTKIVRLNAAIRSTITVIAIQIEITPIFIGCCTRSMIKWNNILWIHKFVIGSAEMSALLLHLYRSRAWLQSHTMKLQLPWSALFYGKYSENNFAINTNTPLKMAQKKSNDLCLVTFYNGRIKFEWFY